jgi:symplekin
MLRPLTDASVPPAPLVAACLRLHERTSDPRAVLAVASALDRSATQRLLPALLELPTECFQLAAARIVSPPGGAPAMSPSELLAALHTLDASGRDAALLRRSMAGVSACLACPDVFTPEALAAAISQLLTRVPLPPLFMRTVIQTQAAAPRLRAFVVGVLSQLVAKRVWEDATQWKGWVMCAQQTAPDSFAAWLQLPPGVLGPALAAAPEALRRELAAFVSSPQRPASVPEATLALLAPAVGVAPEAGDAAAGSDAAGAASEAGQAVAV